MGTGKLKCILLDDDPLSIEIIKDFTKDSSVAEITDHFTCPKTFLGKVALLDFELAILDITMPELDGFHVATLLKDKHIIFITGVESNLKKATKFTTIDLLSKPLDKARLHFGLEKAHKIIHGTIPIINDFGLFKVEGHQGMVKILYSDIVFASVDNKERRHKHIILRNGKKRKLLYCDFETLLNHSSQLFQPNKSELISMDVVAEYDIDLLTLNILGDNGKPKQVTLSRYYRYNFKNKLYS